MDTIKEKLGGAGKYVVGAGAAVGGLAVDGCRAAGGIAVDGCRAAGGAANGVVQRGIGFFAPPPPSPPPPKNNGFFDILRNIGEAGKYVVAGGAGAAVGGLAAEGCRAAGEATNGVIRRGFEFFSPPPPPPPEDDGLFAMATDALIDLGGGVNEYIQNMDPKFRRKCILACSCAAAAGACICGATMILPLVGFGTQGVTGSSLAAWIHATIGNVTVGSFFASFQSAGVLGYAATTKGLIGLCGAAPVFALFRFSPPPEPQSTDMFDILQKHGIYGFTI